MGAMASQITSLTIVYSTVYSGADQREHQSSASLAFVRGIHRSPVNSPHKWPVTRKMLPFDDVIMWKQTGRWVFPLLFSCVATFCCNINIYIYITVYIYHYHLSEPSLKRGVSHKDQRMSYKSCIQMNIHIIHSMLVRNITYWSYGNYAQCHYC